MSTAEDNLINHTETGFAQGAGIESLTGESSGVFAECFLINGFLHPRNPQVGIDFGPLMIAAEGVNGKTPDLTGIEFGQENLSPIVYH